VGSELVNEAADQATFDVSSFMPVCVSGVIIMACASPLGLSPILFPFPFPFLSIHVGKRKLRGQLESAIEKVDLESALEAAIIEKKGGGQAAKEPLFVAPLDAAARLSSALRHPVCGLRLFANCVVLPPEQ
jgi:hypothetical protein